MTSAKTREKSQKIDSKKRMTAKIGDIIMRTRRGRRRRRSDIPSPKLICPAICQTKNEMTNLIFLLVSC